MEKLLTLWKNVLKKHEILTVRAIILIFDVSRKCWPGYKGILNDRDIRNRKFSLKNSYSFFLYLNAYWHHV